jgi:hypothetical protein
MAKRTYECIGTIPLAFTDGQEVETGETFERDFSASNEGNSHEAWLINVGLIRRVEPVPSPKEIQAAVKTAATKKEA